MPVHFKAVRVRFDQTKGIIQTELASANFSRSVLRCGVAINGFELCFGDSNRPIWKQMINIKETAMDIKDKNVSVPVEILMRDKSGTIDDNYGGYVDVLFIAETK